MAWIETHQGLLTNRKTLALALDLELPDLYAASHMIALWLWTLDNAESGDLSSLSPAVIARAAQFPGDPEQFVSASIGAGFLDRDGDVLVIHDWYEYAGKLIERRKEDAERKRNMRKSSAQQRTSTDTAPDDRGMSNGRPADGVRNRTLTVPYVEEERKTTAAADPDPVFMAYQRVINVRMSPDVDRRIIETLVEFKDEPDPIGELREWEMKLGDDRASPGTRLHSVREWLKNKRKDRQTTTAASVEKPDTIPDPAVVRRVQNAERYYAEKKRKANEARERAANYDS